MSRVNDAYEKFTLFFFADKLSGHGSEGDDAGVRNYSGRRPKPHEERLRHAVNQAVTDIFSDKGSRSQYYQ